MKKYFAILRISFEQEFAYKLNFIMWRFRNIMQIVVFFFLWNSVFSGQNSNFFGYTKEKIITYAFLLIFIRAIVLSSRSVDVAGQIASGELSNFLVKPINFFKYWITRDIASKLLNISFSMLEIIILYFILRPHLFIQTNILYIFLFGLSLLIASIIFFEIMMLTNFVPFWVPEIGWGAQFLVIMIFVEFLSGAFFPLDVFPNLIYTIIKLTPFPYLIFIPIKTYLGIDSFQVILQGLLIGVIWLVALSFLVKKVFIKGLKVYEAVGR